MEFVNFNIAELLFKLGFCEKCFGYYYQEPNTAVNNHKEDLVEYTCPYRGANYKDMLQNDLVFNSIDNIYPNIKIYNAPTIAQVLKWLRKEKELHIEFIANASGYCYIISRTPQRGGSDIYTCFDGGTNDVGEWDDYEEAALSAIEYVLDNLI